MVDLATVKLVTLHKRRPDVTVEAFHTHLLGLADAVQGQGGAVRYVQSHTLVQGYKRGELLFDGVSEWTFGTLEAALDARRNAVDVPLADPARTVHMLVDVHVAKAGAVPAGAVKNIEFVNRRPGMALEPFRRYWREVHGPIGATISTILRYEQNHLHAGEYTGEVAPLFDGLAITWFASTAEMRRGSETPEYAVTRADEVNFLPDGHLPIIITREVVDTGAA